jgi:hypothetical protein
LNFVRKAENCFKYLNNSKEKSFFSNAANTDNAVRVQYRLTTSTGVNAKVGYFLNENFIYALLGWQQQRIRCNASFVITDRLGGPAHEFSQTKNFNINAVSLGIGAQRPINENYSIGLEFKVTKLPGVSHQFIIGDINQTKLDGKLNGIRIYSAALRFTYTF